MAKYRVIAASVNIHAGVLGLEPHQAQARRHRVMYLGGNRYDVVGVSFKRGEEFEYDGELPKHLVESVATVAPAYVLPLGFLAAVAETFPEIDATMQSELLSEPELAETAMPDESQGHGGALLGAPRMHGVAEPPPKRKKGARGPKPAAQERAGATISP